MANAISNCGILEDQQKLFSILNRAVTMTNAYTSPFVEDDLRMLRAVRPKFIGRSAYVWVTKSDDQSHFQRAEAWAKRIHREIDTDIVLQAAIFEAIYPAVDKIAIPPWVFEDLGEPVENRNFSFQQMLGDTQIPPQGLNGGPWDGGNVPDLSRPDTFRWFYYRARRYLECGYEAIHLGQIHLIGGVDRGYRIVEKLISHIRNAAHRYGRRKWIILDAHSHGISRNGHLFFDFVSRPASSRPLLDYPKGVALIKRGPSLAGMHPGGWTCEESPTIVEMDNWGGYSLSPKSEDWANIYKRAFAGKWGYDEISWMARLRQQAKSDFLRYAHRWTQIQGEHWFFQMPLCRSLGAANIKLPSTGVQVHYYRANRQSKDCPEGQNDEKAIIQVWSEPEVRNLRTIEVFQDTVTESGLSVPQPVTAFGGIQPLLGGVPGDAACPWSRLCHRGEGRFRGIFAMPFAGTFPLVVTNGGTQTDPTKANGLAGGNDVMVTVEKAGALIQIDFDFESRKIAVTCPESGKSMVA